MTPRQYIAAMSTVVMSVFAVPDWDLLIKIYVLIMIGFVVTVITIAFYVRKIRDAIVNRLVSDAIQEIFKDKDVRKLIEWRMRGEQVRQRIREIVEESRKKAVESKE